MFVCARLRLSFPVLTPPSGAKGRPPRLSVLKREERRPHQRVRTRPRRAGAAAGLQSLPRQRRTGVSTLTRTGGLVFRTSAFSDSGPGGAARQHTDHRSLPPRGIWRSRRCLGRERRSWRGWGWGGISERHAPPAMRRRPRRALAGVVRRRDLHPTCLASVIHPALAMPALRL